MKNIFIGAGIIAAGYFGFKAYQKKQSIDNVSFDVTDVDLAAMKLKVRFTNIGNANLNITAVQNKVYANDIFVGSADKMSAFSIAKSANTSIDFTLVPSLVGGLSVLGSMFTTGAAIPKIRIETTINANGILFNKTTNI
jgi:hypothetical protein